MAHPKRKTSRQRKRTRRAHQALTSPTLSTCSNCGATVKAHRACLECGYYRGRQVLAV